MSCTGATLPGFASDRAMPHFGIATRAGCGAPGDSPSPCEALDGPASASEISPSSAEVISPSSADDEDDDEDDEPSELESSVSVASPELADDGEELEDDKIDFAGAVLAEVLAFGVTSRRCRLEGGLAAASDSDDDGVDDIAKQNSVRDDFYYRAKFGQSETLANAWEKHVTSSLLRMDVSHLLRGWATFKF